MFHMKNPTQIRKAKATTIIQIEKPMFHVKHWLCLYQNQDSLNNGLKSHSCGLHLFRALNTK